MLPTLSPWTLPALLTQSAEALVSPPISRARPSHPRRRHAASLLKVRRHASPALLALVPSSSAAPQPSPFWNLLRGLPLWEPGDRLSDNALERTPLAYCRTPALSSLGSWDLVPAGIPTFVFGALLSPLWPPSLLLPSSVDYPPPRATSLFWLFSVPFYPQDSTSLVSVTTSKSLFPLMWPVLYVSNHLLITMPLSVWNLMHQKPEPPSLPLKQLVSFPGPPATYTPALESCEPS